MKSSKSSNSIEESITTKTDAQDTRRIALKKIAKFSTYTAPILLASISGKSNAQPAYS